MTQSLVPFTDAEVTRMLALRKALLRDGRPLVALPSDLMAHSLEPWVGTWFGVTCAPSTVEVVAR